MDYPFYILDIDDDDNLSGVDAVGLVEHPAIELGWMAFSKQNMESYTDYPESASNNAKRALEWAEKNGWGDCGTDVGKQRANQLAKREPISEETISRMASFERHRQNSDVPYSEGCGGLMWDAWGGTSGIEWAQNKLKEIKAGAMKFQVQDESEQILAGALMVADLPIPRVDEFGDIFYVKFPANVIKRIVYKIKANGVQLKFNIGHDETKTIEAVLVSDFLVSEKMGMQAPAWHKPLSEGSWFGFVKIPNKEDYEWAKENLTGFSIEGIFDQIKYADVDEQIIDKIKQNMSKIKRELGNDVFAKLKKLIFTEDEEKKEEKMGEAALEDGTPIKWEGELMEGTAISVVTEEGEMPAPDATHTLSDGTKVTTENGLVTSIEEVVTETVEEVVASAIEPIATELASLTEKFSAMQKELAKVNQVNKQMFEALEVLAKQEPEEPKAKFNKTAVEVNGKVAVLSSLMKLKNK